jgi:hypothetical protein
MRTGSLLAMSLAMSGCDVVSNGRDSGVSLGFAVGGSGGAALRAATTVGSTVTAAGLVVTDGTNEIVFTSIELVLAEVELDRVEHDGTCPTDSSDDSCEKLEAGPILVSLPVDGTVENVVTVDVTAGSYDEIEFEIDRPGDDTQADADFVVANPDFEEISIRALGTYNGTAFEYAARVQAEQEIELSAPLDVTLDGAHGLTLSVDVAGWFVGGDGLLIDPATALDSANEEDIEDNIESSFAAYGDDDGDGVANEDDDDNSGRGGDDNGSDDEDADTGTL